LDQGFSPHSMVDYSKWDKLDVSDDEAPAKPQVHRFDAPQAVTIGGKDSQGSVQIQSQASQEAEAAPARNDGNEAMEQDDDEPMEPDDEPEAGMEPGEDRREDVLQCRELAERALRRGDAAEAVRLLEKAMGMGGANCPGLEDILRAARLATGGGRPVTPQEHTGQSTGSTDPASGARVGDRYAWSQTKDSLEVNVFVEEGTKAKDVDVAVSEAKVNIKVRGLSVFEGEWEYKVLPDEDPDWEMVSSNGQRAVRLTVRKADLPGGMSIVVWWQRVLKGEPAIDVSKIQGRKLEASESFAKAWKEAHIQFKDRVKNRKPVPVPVDPSDGEEDNACDVDN